ncbi:uncharacterized protein EDB91DRAFT_1255622 [Suillus paluster]|uniref:uncharacterized protein n=1 Tax=Suillus paluster TaxID=48578 RepID=UPI001B872E0E|nr:uncharacterized protein EDB91DRAFT_1255622 [Suillus paluster]KAG1723473.1 hypothetical protein EDB91DRAFT_1255622 [Suillus paluster]
MSTSSTAAVRGYSPHPSNYFLSEEAGCNLPAVTGRCRKVLRFITQLNYILEKDYARISCIIEDLLAKPRWTYNHDTPVLFVEMPSPVHETVLRVISSGLEQMNRILLDLIFRNLLNSDSHTNLIMNAGALKLIPDIAHMVTTITGPPMSTVPVIGDVTVLQPRADLLRRLKDTVKAFPDILMLIIAVIDERIPYSAPEHQSRAWQNLRTEASVRSCTTFLSNRSGSPSLDVPSDVVEGHPWCAVSNPNLTARGELFPDNTMDDVITMIENGLSLVRDHYAHLSQRVSPNVDITARMAAHIRLPFKWDRMLCKLALASMGLAYDQYWN